MIINKLEFDRRRGRGDSPACRLSSNECESGTMDETRLTSAAVIMYIAVVIYL